MEEDQDLGNIYKTTFGIMFFGTPHRGSSYAQLGIWAKDIAVAAGFDANDKILRSLKPDDEIAGLLSKDFARMLSERAFKVFSFQEGQGFKGTYFMSRKVSQYSICQSSPVLIMCRSSMTSLLAFTIRGSARISLMPITWRCAGFRTKMTTDTGKSKEFYQSIYWRYKTRKYLSKNVGTLKQ
jgi:hypothetical protein